MAGSNIGVFVGASSLDYGNLRILDAASGDAYAATGNTLSIISNRISYIFDLKGPSFTVDTACSSSLVAFDNAVQAIRSGRVDTAVVAGVTSVVVRRGCAGSLMSSTATPGASSDALSTFVGNRSVVS